MALIEYQNVSFVYADGTAALQHVSFAIERGQKVAFLGSNGSGKTTAFLLMNGLLKPSQGRIWYDGQPVSYRPNALHELRKKIGIVFHDPDTQIFANSVFEEISFGPKNLNWDDDCVRARVEEALQVCEIADLRQKPPHFLSFGQKRLVTIASMVAMQSDVIVLDEPTSGLDHRHARAVLDLLANLHARGTTIVFSTHDAELAFEFADVGYILNGGHIVQHGRIENLFQDPGCLQAAHIAVPYVLDIYQTLVTHRLLTPQTIPPRTLPQLKALLEHVGCGEHVTHLLGHGYPGQESLD